MRLNRTHKSLIIITLVIVFIGLYYAVVYALGTWDSGYRADSGAGIVNVEIGDLTGTASSDQCGTVDNNSGNNLFVPTRTTGEWQAFRDNSGVAVADTGALGTDTNCAFCGDVCTGAETCQGGVCQAACVNNPVWAGNGPVMCVAFGPYPLCADIFGQSCPTVDQDFACTQGVCGGVLYANLPIICQCPSGWADCDPDPSCCETQLGTMANCLSCGDACGGGETCEATGCEPIGGVWVVGAGGACLPPGMPPCEPYFCPAELGQPCSPINATRCCKEWCITWWGQYGLLCQ